MCVKIHQQLKLFFLEKQQKTQELSDILSKQYDVPSCAFSPRMSSVSGLSKAIHEKKPKGFHHFQMFLQSCVWDFLLMKFHSPTQIKFTHKNDPLLKQNNSLN
jgi:hypothetical protein